ncbi:MAG: hypothetical protein ACKVVP_21070, partial [Chloroflexota bacterium]
MLNTRGLPMIPGRLALVSEAATLPNLDVLDGQGAQLAPGRLVPPLDSAPTGSVSLPQSGSALFQALPAVVPGRVGLAPTHRLIPRPVDSLPRTSGGTAQPESIPNTGNLSGEVSSVLGGSATLPPLIAIETMVPRLLTEDRALAERVSLRSGELPLESDEPPAA